MSYTQGKIERYTNILKNSEKKNVRMKKEKKQELEKMKNIFSIKQNSKSKSQSQSQSKSQSKSKSSCRLVFLNCTKKERDEKFKSIVKKTCFCYL